MFVSGAVKEAVVDWRNLSAEEIEYEFNPQHSVPDFSSFQVERTRISEQARREMKADLDVAFGDGPTRTVDVFPAAPKDGVAVRPPVHIFFHGGYWRTQDKANFAFIAKTLVAEGITTVVANYDLCPAATLDGAIESAMAAIAWTYRHAADYGSDPERITLSGNSAGAHIAAMAMGHDWSAEGLPADLVKGTVPISGIYDPEPAMHISVNAEIRMTAEVARRNNVFLRYPGRPIPVALFVGGLETAQWQLQTELYAEHLRRHGFAPTVETVPERHHFNIMDQYLDAAQPIPRAILGMAWG